MKTTDIENHNIHWQGIIWGKLYFFAIDPYGTTYMLKVNNEGHLEIV